MKRSGKYAYVDGIPCTQAWGVNRNSSASRYIASCVPDGSAAVEGNIDETGSMNGIGYLPPMPSEDDFAFIGVASAQTGQVVNYEGNILVTETTISLPVKAGTPITWSSNFGVQGELSKTTAPPRVDATRVPGASAKYGKIEIEAIIDGGSWQPVVIQNAQMKFMRSVSTTVEAGLTYREAGNLEADISFDVEDDDRDNPLYAVNVTKNVRVYVNETDYYYFDAILFQSQSNFKVDRTTGALIGYTVNGIWTALRDQTPAALGEILYPGGDPFYSEAYV